MSSLRSDCSHLDCPFRIEGAFQVSGEGFAMWLAVAVNVGGTECQLHKEKCHFPRINALPCGW